MLHLPESLIYFTFLRLQKFIYVLYFQNHFLLLFNLNQANRTSVTVVFLRKDDLEHNCLSRSWFPDLLGVQEDIYIEPVSYNIQENLFSFIRQWHLAPPVSIKVPDDQGHNTFSVTGYLRALWRPALTFARDRKNIKNSQTYYRKMKSKEVFSTQVIFLNALFLHSTVMSRTIQ